MIDIVYLTLFLGWGRKGDFHGGEHCPRFLLYADAGDWKNPLILFFFILL